MHQIEKGQEEAGGTPVVDVHEGGVAAGLSPRW